MALICLRLTFGGAPCPFEWCTISESICDLAVAILQHKDWDSETLHAPEPDLVPAPKTLSKDIPFGAAQDLVVDVLVNPRGTVDIYIDNKLGLTVGVDGSSNAMRLRCALLLAIHTAARSKSEKELILREEMAALNKLLAEAGPTEIKTVLGWLLGF